MTQDLTRALLLETIRKRPLLINKCSLCGYPCSFEFRGDVFGYDAGCDCTYGRGGWSPRDESSLDFYLDPKHGWIDTLNTFLGGTS